MTSVLVVDDNEQNLYLLQALFSGHAYAVSIAADGVEALEKARESHPDVIITDILMPRMDGYALCRQWKLDEKLRHIPLVFYTGTYTDPKDRQLALDMGADRFVLKPQEPEVLLAIVEEVMLDIMFELPDQEAGQKYCITDDVVYGRTKLFPLPERKNKSA